MIKTPLSSYTDCKQDNGSKGSFVAFPNNLKDKIPSDTIFSIMREKNNRLKA